MVNSPCQHRPEGLSVCAFPGSFFWRTVMKEKIHPKVFNAKVRCACGNEVELRSTKGENLGVEICAACHPFYTGKARFVDTAGRIDRFRKKYAGLEAKK